MIFSIYHIQMFFRHERTTWFNAVLHFWVGQISMALLYDIKIRQYSDVTVKAKYPAEPMQTSVLIDSSVMGS